MFFKDDNKRKIDLAHRDDDSKEALLRKNKEEREKRSKNKKQQEAALLVQRYVRSFKTSKALFKQLTNEEQIPKIVGEVMSVLRQQAMQQSNAVVADKIQLKILQNALPKLINRINVLLKT